MAPPPALLGNVRILACKWPIPPWVRFWGIGNVWRRTSKGLPLPVHHQVWPGWSQTGSGSAAAAPSFRSIGAVAHPPRFALVKLAQPGPQLARFNDYLPSSTFEGKSDLVSPIFTTASLKALLSGNNAFVLVTLPPYRSQQKQINQQTILILNKHIFFRMLALLLLWVGLTLGGTPNCGKTLLTSLPEGDPQVCFCSLYGSMLIALFLAEWPWA